MGIIAGTIQAVNEKTTTKGKQYGVKLLGAWYNGFGSCQAKKGDLVEIEFTESGQWRNIKTITPSLNLRKDQSAPLKAEQPNPVRPTDVSQVAMKPSLVGSEDVIVREVAIKAAAVYVASDAYDNTAGDEDVVLVAKRFARYIKTGE